MSVARAIIFQHRSSPVTFDGDQAIAPPESVARAKAFQLAERMRAARTWGIPQDLLDIWEVFGDEEMEKWITLIRMVRAK